MTLNKRDKSHMVSQLGANLSQGKLQRAAQTNRVCRKVICGEICDIQTPDEDVAQHSALQ